MWVIGFDPGGVGRFGWRVAEAHADLPIAVRATGMADSAADALAAVKRVPGIKCPDGIAIDSPLFWVA